MSDAGEHGTAVAIIPARYGSSRVPGKPLADIGGKTMVERVYERARLASSLERVNMKTEPTGMISASHTKTRKMSGMISSSLIMIGPPRMIGSSPF